MRQFFFRIRYHPIPLPYHPEYDPDAAATGSMARHILPRTAEVTAVTVIAPDAPRDARPPEAMPNDPPFPLLVVSSICSVTDESDPFDQLENSAPVPIASGRLPETPYSSRQSSTVVVTPPIDTEVVSVASTAPAEALNGLEVFQVPAVMAIICANWWFPESLVARLSPTLLYVR